MRKESTTNNLGKLKWSQKCPEGRMTKKKKKKVPGFSRMSRSQHRLRSDEAAWHLVTEGTPCHGTDLSLPTLTQIPPGDLLITGILDPVYNHPRGAAKGPKERLLSPQGYSQQQRHYVVHGASFGADR